MRNKKGDLDSDALIPWAIAIVVLILFIVLAVLLTSKGTNALSYFQRIFKFS